MDNIYKLLSGEYVDLSKIVCISKPIFCKYYRWLGFYVNFQLMSNSLQFGYDFKEDEIAISLYYGFDTDKFKEWEREEKTGEFMNENIEQFEIYKTWKDLVEKWKEYNVKTKEKKEKV